MSVQLSSNNIYIIIPAYNESAIISQVIEALLPFQYRIVIVDDGSDQPLQEQLKKFPAVHCLRHITNLGQGAALQTGIDFALQHSADYLVTFDADGQHSVADIPAMLAPLLNKEADITLASRFLEEGKHNAPAIRKWVLKAARWVNYFFTGLYLSDAHNGLRAMTQSTAQHISLKENRMAHATEILLLIKKNKWRLKEVSASVNYTNYSKGKGQSIFNSIRIFFDLVLHKLFE